jgi:hypothetical protein
MRQGKAGVALADGGEFHRKVSELVGVKMHDLTLALDAALYADHACRKVMRRRRS